MRDWLTWFGRLRSPTFCCLPAGDPGKLEICFQDLEGQWCTFQCEDRRCHSSDKRAERVNSPFLHLRFYSGPQRRGASASLSPPIQMLVSFRNHPINIPRIILTKYLGTWWSWLHKISCHSFTILMEFTALWRSAGSSLTEKKTSVQV